MKVANIFPYQIKDRNLFYNRDHESVPFLERDEYWDDQIRKSIEGWWVNDNGTWVFMMPKLYWQMNVFVGSVVYNKHGGRRVGKLTLTDREFIIFSYLLCCYGYSGFLNDEFFTSNKVVDLVERGIHLDYKWVKKLDNPNIYDKHGKMKKYVEPWEYLTRHYLVKEPQGVCLGNALYDNPMMDAYILGARNSTKTMAVAGGHVSHEFFTGGIRDWKDVGNIHTDEIKIGIGSIDSGKVKGFSNVILDFYKNLPGEFVDRNGVRFVSPLYRKLIGEWGTGDVVHEYIDKKTKQRKGSGSTLEFRVYTGSAASAAVFVGGRRRSIVREEIGLQKDPIGIMNAEAETLMQKVDGLKIGIAVSMGTSGFLEHIEGNQTIFYNPDRFNIFGIKNEWEDENSKICLFLPDYYVSADYKDENGNTKIQDAYNASVAKVKELQEKHASGQEIRDFELNNPNWPSQMFLDNKASILCSDLARIRRVRLLERGFYRVIGDLYRDDDGIVKFKENPKGIVIDNYSSKTTQQPKDTSWSIYEMPIKNAEKGLYRIGYDTIRSDGLGRTDDASLVSIVVRKGFDLSRRGKQNTIVARWTGRLGSKDKNHNMAVMAAEFYGALILHEDDVGDFATYCRNNKKWKLLASTPYLGTSIKVSGNSIWNVGIKMGDNPDLKAHALELYNEHLEQEIGYDEETEAPVRNIDNIDDLLILDEIAKFGSGNFDNISSELLLMIWNRAEAAKTYASGDQGEKSVKVNNMRELYEMATRNLGYADEFVVKQN